LHCGLDDDVIVIRAGSAVFLDLFSAPVTLIYGDSDSRPNERERTRSLIPAAQMVALKNTGQFSAVENPSELARVIFGAE